MSEDVLPEILGPFLDYLSSVLPAPLFSIVLSLLANLYSLIISLFSVCKTLIQTPPSAWDAETILPPIITLLMAYLALLSFYRTTGWMVRTTLAFVKWGFLLTALGAATGYLLANAGRDGYGVGQLGPGLVSSLSGMLLSVFSGGTQDQNQNARRRTRTQSSPHPKAWESWDRHREWQYAENAGQDQDGAHVQEVVGKVLRSAGDAIRESGWWDAARGVAGEFVKGLQTDGQGASRAGSSRREPTENKKEKKDSRSR